MWDLTIHSPSRPSILAGTRSLLQLMSGPRGRGFHTFIKNVLFSSPNRCGISQSTPFKAQRPLWHSFPSPIDVGAQGERFPHSYKECFVLLPNRCGISQSTPFEAQRPRWHSLPSPIDVGDQRPCWHTAYCLALVPFVTV